MTQDKSNVIYKNLLLKFIGEPDPLLEMLNWLTHEMMIVEAEQKVGAQKHKVSNERTTHFSGNRVRRFDTRLGTMYLVVPKLRKGGYIPFFVTEKKRSEQALIQVVQEAFISGVSTRKIERLAQALGIENISGSQVSEINKGLDDQVNAFRNRPLDKEYPIIWVDALYEKIRVNGRVSSSAIMVICGINLRGEREVLSIEGMPNESEQTYREVFKSLKERGLEKVWLTVSDAHSGLKSALEKEFLGASWQRCKVHFMRNILAKVPHKLKSSIAEKLKQIWNQPDEGSARKYANSVIDELEATIPDAIKILIEGIEDSLSFYSFPLLDKRKISSTNILERLNKEIRRRSRVVGVFPSLESYLRLVTCHVIECTEDWTSGKKYIKCELIAEQSLLLKSA